MVIYAKDLHMSIKKGETAEEVANTYGISVEELFSYIRDKMHAGSKNLIRELEKNEKIRRKTAHKEKESETTAEEEPITNDDEESKEFISLETRNERLAQLLSEEADLSAELCTLERCHESMVDRRREIITSAKEASERLLSMQEALLREEAAVEEAIIEYEVLANDMTSNTAERRIYEELLEEIRGEIEELKKVTVILREDGTLECSDPDILKNISAEDEAVALSELMEIPEAEDFTLKQLRSIARAKLIVKLGYEVKIESQKSITLMEV